MNLWRWIGLAVLVGCSIFSTWKVDTWRFANQLADLSAAFQADLDAKATTEKTRDLAENERLRADVTAADRRLRIVGRCSAGSGDLSNTARAYRLDDGGAVELAGAAGRTVFDIRTEIIKDRAALKGLQEYVRVCRTLNHGL